MAFPSTSVLDALSGTAGTDLSALAGGNWSAISGITELEIATGGTAATGITNSDNNADYWNVENFGADSEAFVTIDVKSDLANSVSVGVRNVQETSGATIDGYWLTVANVAAGTDTFTLNKITNGAATAMGAAFTQEITNGDKIGIKVTGGNPTTAEAWYHNGTSWASLGSYDDSTSPHQAAGKVLIYTSSTVARVSDFGGGTVVISGGTNTIIIVPTGPALS